jgi:8-oxo-dGTP pyrophosphatase MutT (NUDIX family)
MNIEIFDDNLTKQDIKGNPLRIACRGIVQKDGLLLTVLETKWDVTMFPGGGLEDGESLQECAVREVLEETGIEVANPEEVVRITEHFKEYSFQNVYFKCDYVNDTKTTTFTDVEKEVGLITRWVTPFELMDNLANNMTLHEHGTNIHNREFLALINSI